jgi:hypothetical protein
VLQKPRLQTDELTDKINTTTKFVDIGFAAVAPKSLARVRIVAMMRQVVFGGNAGLT